MSRKNYLKISLIGLVVVAALVFLSFAATGIENAYPASQPADCCLEEEGSRGAGEMIWESLPRQFMSSINVMP